MFKLARARSGQRIIDPGCGDGVFLRNAPPTKELYACEIDKRYSGLINNLLPKGQAVQGDALTELIPFWGSFDLVIGNPPFSAQAYLERRLPVLQGYDLGCGRSSQCLEVLFLELFLKLAKPRGRIAIILPDGPLSNRPFTYVRDWLLRRAHIEIVVSLPRTTFSATTAKTNIIVARKLPLSTQPYREPSLLYACGDLSELDERALRIYSEEGELIRHIVLADTDDWRPEAQTLNEPESSDVETIRLGEVFRLRTGFALYGDKRSVFDRAGRERIPLLRAKNLHPEGGLRMDENTLHISTTSPMYREDAVLREGEIVFVRVGAGCYGRAAVVPVNSRMQADDWLHVLTPVMEVDVQGVAAWLNGPEGRQHTSRLAKGVGTLSISKSSLAEMRIPVRFVQKTLVLQEPATRYRVMRRKIAARRVV